MLDRQLRDKTAQAVLMPRYEGDVVRIAAACARHRVPVTARGGGTGNYGQAVPLRGGIILDIFTFGYSEISDMARNQYDPAAS